LLSGWNRLVIVIDEGDLNFAVIGDEELGVGFKVGQYATTVRSDYDLFMIVVVVIVAVAVFLMVVAVVIIMIVVIASAGSECVDRDGAEDEEKELFQFHGDCSTVEVAYYSTIRGR